MAETLKDMLGMHVLSVNLEVLKEVAGAVPNWPTRHGKWQPFLWQRNASSKGVAPGNYLLNADFISLRRQLSYMFYKELLLLRSTTMGQLFR